MIEALLLATTRVTTLREQARLTNATGFFFARDERLYLITNRHVVLDEPSGHRPDGLEIELHVDPDNVAATTQFAIPLYDANGTAVWTEAADAVGTLDVVAIRLDRAALPATLALHAFTPAHLLDDLSQIEVGTSVLIVGFPLGFHDALHRLPVARSAVVASAFGFRFQGHGYFLTDALTHRGMSGAPVVAKLGPAPSRGDLTWTLLGVHASRLDMSNRELQDDPLNLNCAWYADALLPLTEPVVAASFEANPGPATAGPAAPTENPSGT